MATDGNFHTYRLDLGLVVWWRDTLTDLRIQPLGTTGAGETASIDYVEAGDMPGDVLTVYTTNLNMAPGVTAATRQSVESKHFVFWWDPAVNPGGQTNLTTCSATLCECWRNHIRSITKCSVITNRSTMFPATARYKVNLTTWYSGYWMGGPYLNVDTSGLQDEGWGNPVPHEYAHVIDGQQPGYLVGGHWESHANYVREARTNWFAPFFASNSQSTMDLNPAGLVELPPGCKTPHLLRLPNFSGNPGLCRILWILDADLAVQLWSLGSQNMTVYDKLASLLPAGVEY